MYLLAEETRDLRDLYLGLQPTSLSSFHRSFLFMLCCPTYCMHAHMHISVYLHGEVWEMCMQI